MIAPTVYHEAEVRFFLSCVPPTTSHHHKKIVRFYVRGQLVTRLADRPELEDAKATIDSLLLPFQIPAPVRPPVILQAVFTWPWLGGHGKRIREAGPKRHTSKPDLSNVLKTLEDRLVNLRFLEDDRSVSEVHLQKFWGSDPGIDITITPIAMPAPVAVVRTRRTAPDLFSGAEGSRV